MKLSNIINIDTQPFDPATYKEAEEEEYVDNDGTKRVRMRDQNVIRWRRTLNEVGSSGMESNARSDICLASQIPSAATFFHDQACLRGSCKGRSPVSMCAGL